MLALLCVNTARLNYKSQISLSCLFLAKVGHQRDSSVRFGGRSKTAAIVSSHIFVYLLAHFRAVGWQTGWQRPHRSLDPTAPLTPGLGECLAA